MKKIVTILLVALLVLGAVVLLQKRKAQLARDTPAAILPVVVQAVKLTKDQVTLTLPAMGVVGSELSSTLSTKVSGRVVKIFKQEGDVVQQGDVLARIDATDLAAKKESLHLKRAGLDYEIAAKKEDLKSLRTTLAVAGETHQRTLELLAVKGASQEQSRQEEATIAQFEAKISAASNGIASLEKNKEILLQDEKEIQSLLSYTDILAPTCGTVSKREVMVGDMAMPGKTLFRIAACSGQYLNLSLPASLQATQALWQGHALALSARNQATATTGLAQYVAPMPKESGTLEGQYVRIDLVIYAGNTVLLPMDALLTIDGRTSVFIWENGAAVKTPVTIIARGSEGVVVAEALEARTVLMAKPDILLRVASGAPVKVMAASPPVDSKAGA
ncbi:MAG: efflux RND transporter periplasmic adaptor subunit [Proteobacteria bacterium]|nr:efflux RND transporter periplasmic adaptor subunit [Pseudomonadota bacterium]MBU0966667.1 efflux RND transporter periplasmic adaptor subunit [Pseudomonadota bacterium]